MDTTTYRRRAAGKGARVGGTRRGRVLSGPEQRRLVQLGVSILLFLLVFIGRGALPDQIGTWRSILTADMDLGGAVAALGGSIADGGHLPEALEAFWAGMTGAEQGAEAAGAAELPLVKIPTPRDQMEDPSFGELPSLNGSGYDSTAGTDPDAGTGVSAEDAPAEDAPAADTEAGQEELVVTAVAQAYSPDGEALPERVSFAYYPLGLKETALPVVGRVTSGFGYRDHPVSGTYSFHAAQDISAKRGTEIHAYAAGTVRYIGENDIYGLYVRLDHDNGVSTFYAHCQELLVHKGEAVECGQTIAMSGATGNVTGPHLHFSIEKDGIRLDPAWYLDEPSE